MAERECVLIYRLGSLGDTVVALPALRLVARAFPSAERWVLTNFSNSAKATPMAQVLEGTGLVHGYLEYSIGLRNRAQLAILRRRIRQLGARTLVYLAAPRGRMRAWRDALFFRSCGIRRLIGVPYSRHLREVRRLDNGFYEHEGARLARSIGELGDARLDDIGSFDLALTAEEQATADSALVSLDGGRFLIAGSVGTKADVKDWGDANWARLLRSLSREMRQWSFVMVGAADERERSERLLKHWHGRTLNLCGILPVRKAAAVLARCWLYLGHDSGPMHLAAAAGTPCVVVFSSRNLPGEWFPYGKVHRVLYQPMPCQGCRLSVCVERQKACIRAITVEAVQRAVLEVACGGVNSERSQLAPIPNLQAGA